MSQDFPQISVHPSGEQPPIEQEAAGTLDTWAGPVRVEWDSTAPLTPHGQLPFFIEYLKVESLFDALVADCPLAYVSPNAPKKRDLLGMAMLSVLVGHKRYAHITALRNDGVLPELLGMEKIVSEDAVHRGFKAIAENKGQPWLQRHPTKVVRVALENAVSVASVLLLAEATMTEIPEPRREGRSPDFGTEADETAEMLSLSIAS